MKNKPRIQPALRSLSDSDRELLANWLRSDHYDAVLERVRKPRSEGGLGLAAISKSPLQTFYAKVALLDLINSRVPEDKKMTISQFESLANGDLLLSSSYLAPNPTLNPDLPTESSPYQPFPVVSGDVHDAILEATYDFAISGENTPTQLLALQRLADFPARAEYREHKRQLELRNEQFTREKHTHKLSMDEHRKTFDEQRMALARRSQEFREEMGRTRASRVESGASPGSGSSPNAPKDRKFKMWTAEEIVSNQAKVEAAIQADPFLRQVGIPPSSDAQESLSEASSQASSNPAESPSSQLPSEPKLTSQTSFENEDGNTQLPPESHVPAGQSDSSPAFQCRVASTEQARPSGTVDSPEPASPLPSPSALAPSSDLNTHDLEDDTVERLSKSPVSIEDRVNNYTLARHFEALDGKDPQKVGSWTAHKFQTKLHHCPSGQQELPCPDHGDFPNRFWEATPESADHFDVLRAKNLPYTAPVILLQNREREERRAAAMKAAPCPEALLHSATGHAILRWRSYTPRPPGSPPPDESWTEECPCGAPHPCDLHPDLWSEVRYLRPSDPDYAAALKRHGIPVYAPTPSDLNPNPNPNLNPAQSKKPSSQTLSNGLAESLQAALPSPVAAYRQSAQEPAPLSAPSDIP